MTASETYVQPNKAQNGMSKMPKSKFRESQEEYEIPVTNNIMFDRRVVRGNTYQVQVVTSNQQREAERIAKLQQEKLARQREIWRQQLSAKPSTPPPVPGRSHMVIQTEEYLEELNDRPIENDAETQTAPFLDRPPSPLFVPAKIGYDKDTQIENGDLFDFDTEVIPILEVLVGKTLETSLYEVMEEEEIAALQKRQTDFEKMRNAEIAEVQRLESESKRKEDEKLRRIEQERERMRQRATLREKVAARSFTRQYLSGISNTIFDQLEEDGLFYDPLKKEIETQFLPDVLSNVVKVGADIGVARSALDDMLLMVFQKAQEAQLKGEQERVQEMERIRIEEEEKIAREKAEAEAAAAEANEENEE